MALREFTAEDGREWHVWDITPEKMHPTTRAEDYLQGVLEGWLVFEAADGESKARLYPIPATWITATEDELREMLRGAEPVREQAERKSGMKRVVSSGLAPDAAHSAPRGGDREVAHSGTPSMDVRTFRYPGGRVWTVAERLAADEEGGESRVMLRFSSGSRTLDMENFPADWVRYSDDRLIDLLCVAFPRPADREQSDSIHHRRRGDATPS